MKKISEFLLEQTKRLSTMELFNIVNFFIEKYEI